jgi:hypothetical protein
MISPVRRVQTAQIWRTPTWKKTKGVIPTQVPRRSTEEAPEIKSLLRREIVTRPPQGTHFHHQRYPRTLTVSSRRWSVWPYPQTRTTWIWIQMPPLLDQVRARILDQNLFADDQLTDSVRKPFRMIGKDHDLRGPFSFKTCQRHWKTSLRACGGTRART